MRCFEVYTLKGELLYRGTDFTSFTEIISKLSTDQVVRSEEREIPNEETRDHKGINVSH